jgi:hypothetical protein
MADNAWQPGHIRYLGQALIIADTGHHGLVGKDDAVSAHLALFRQAPPVFVYFFHLDGLPFFHVGTSGSSILDTRCWILDAGY